MWVEVIDNLTLAMSNRKNKLPPFIITLWVVVLLVAVGLLWPKKVIVKTTDTVPLSVAPASESNGLGAAAPLPTGAATGSDLQGAPVPSGAMSNILQ